MTGKTPLWRMGLALFFGIAILGCSGSQESSSTDAGTATTMAAFSPDVPNADLSARTVTKGELTFVADYQDGYQYALAVGKPSLVFFTDSTCPYCREMAAEAFLDPRVVSLAERFVCVLVDVEREPVICQQFRIRSFPTVLFLSPRGVPLNRFTGKRSGSEVAQEMQAALQATARRIEQPQPTLQR